MPSLKDMTGLKFGRLTVLERSNEKRRDKQARWVCICECGTEKSVSGNQLRSGETSSCGCRRREVTTAIKTTHGLSRKRPAEYRSWLHMRGRCLTPTDKKWPIYGGRGIAVCSRWDSFDAFFEDMGKKPSTSHSLDRIDVNGNYEPANCRWATAKEQGNNTRSNRVVEHNGLARTISEWADHIGVKAGTLAWRIRAGWPTERALNFQ